MQKLCGVFDSAVMYMLEYRIPCGVFDYITFTNDGDAVLTR